MAYQVGDTNPKGAVLKDIRGPVEIWVSERGEYIVYLNIDETDYLFKKRQDAKEAMQLFRAADLTVRTARHRRSEKDRVKNSTVDVDGYQFINENGPLEVWKSPKGDFVVYLIVKNRKFTDDLYNIRGNLAEAEALMNKVRRLLYPD